MSPLLQQRDGFMRAFLMRKSIRNLLLHCWLYKILGLVPEASERIADSIREEDKLQSEEIGMINSSASNSMKETQISLTSGPRRAFRTVDREGVRWWRGPSDLAGSRFENRDG
jgi:hypothetical protein